MKEMKIIIGAADEINCCYCEKQIVGEAWGNYEFNYARSSYMHSDCVKQLFNEWEKKINITKAIHLMWGDRSSDWDKQKKKWVSNYNKGMAEVSEQELCTFAEKFLQVTMYYVTEICDCQYCHKLKKTMEDTPDRARP